MSWEMSWALYMKLSQGLNNLCWSFERYKTATEIDEALIVREKVPLRLSLKCTPKPREYSLAASSQRTGRHISSYTFWIQCSC